MSVTSWKTAGTVATALYDPLAAGAGDNWTSPTNAQGAANSSYATMVMATNPGQRYSLQASNFGFTTGDIPSGATPLGIEFRVTRKNVMTGTRTVNDQYVFFVPAAGTLGQGSNLADAADWATSDEQKVYGGATSLAGQSWAAADFLDADFGIHLVPAISATGAKGSTATASVDSIESRVHYSAVGTKASPSSGVCG